MTVLLLMKLIILFIIIIAIDVEIWWRIINVQY